MLTVYVKSQTGQLVLETSNGYHKLMRFSVQSRQKFTHEITCVPLLFSCDLTVGSVKHGELIHVKKFKRLKKSLRNNL